MSPCLTFSNTFPNNLTMGPVNSSLPSPRCIFSLSIVWKYGQGFFNVFCSLLYPQNIATVSGTKWGLNEYLLNEKKKNECVGKERNGCSLLIYGHLNLHCLRSDLRTWEAGAMTRQCFVRCQFDNDDKLEGCWVMAFLALAYLYLNTMDLSQLFKMMWFESEYSINF